MDFALSPDQKALADSVSKFAAGELNEGVQERDRGRGVSPGAVAQVR